jgi:Domain of unknown function (DUF2529)
MNGKSTILEALMLKMFSTQLAGLLNRIQDKQEENFEDAGRLLAQASAGDGRIFIFGVKEMHAISLEATVGAEPLRRAALWDGSSTEGFIAADRVLIISRFSSDPDAIKAAKLLQSEGIPFVGVSTANSIENDDSLVDIADVHIDLLLKKGLIPDENGERIGFPAPIAALFVYYGVRFIIEEILNDYE